MSPADNKHSKKKVISKLKKTFTTIFTIHRLKYLYEFSFVVIIYGSLLNFVFATLLNYAFNLKYLLAMGIGFYFVKEELPRIIGKCFPPTRL